RAGIRVEKANPREARLSEQRLHQRRQTVSDAEVFAVARGVLSDEAKLFDALRLERLRLTYERRDGPAAELAAHLWDRAERAWIRTTLGHFQIPVRCSLSEYARQIFVE